jgi:S-adenosyl-L-methionine hydrolase (adenosine-forming)
MSIITLTSDWNSSDFYVGAVKGLILRNCHDITIVDISHSISAFNSAQAAFVIRNAYPNFPKGTIHIILVNTESSATRPFLLVRADEHFFIGTDNGIFSLILGDKPEKIVQIKGDEEKSKTAIELFSSVACKLASGVDMEELGVVINSYNQRIPLRPTIENLTLTGSVIYIDSFQNAITNITRDLFDRIKQNRAFEIFIQSKHYKVTQISNFYNDVPDGELLVLFNSVGLLEVAINNGNAARLLNLDVNSTIRVEFDRK